MTLGYDIENVSPVTCSIGLSGWSRVRKGSYFKICNIVIPWPMEVLHCKIKRGMIKEPIIDVLSHVNLNEHMQKTFFSRFLHD